VRNAAHGVVFRPASMKRMVQRVAISGAAALVLFATPAAARVRVFVGAGVPYPLHPYYYYPPYWAYPPYPYVAPSAVPPPGWVPGHWEWRYDAAGRRYRVWVPPHLR
jgi:hypothetical protein